MMNEMIQDEEDNMSEETHTFEQPSVTFNDPNYNVQALAVSDEKESDEEKKPEEPAKKTEQSFAEEKSETKTKDIKDDEDEHEHDDWEANIFKSTGLPTYTAEQVKQDLALIKKHVTKKGTGNRCLPEDMAKIHWTAQIKGQKEIVEDSRKKNGVNNPKSFIIGNFDKVKCFDLIVPQMKQGESADVMCPS